MSSAQLSDNFYDKIKPRLYERVGRQLRSANHVLDIGCGDCELPCYLSETYGQKVTGIDISSDSFPDRRNISKNWPLVRCIRRSDSRLDLLQETHRVLKPAGKILVVEFPYNSLAQKLWNEKYFTKQQLIDYLGEAGFKNIQAMLIENKQILWASGDSSTKDNSK